MTRIEAQILKSQKRIAALKEKKRQQKLKRLKREQKSKTNNLRPRGRPKLKPQIIERARKLAQHKPLADVALSLDISRRSLVNYGITRKALNAENALETESKAKNKK